MGNISQEQNDQIWVGGLKRLRASAATSGERDEGGSEREQRGQTSVLGEIVRRCKPGPERPVRKERARRPRNPERGQVGRTGRMDGEMQGEDMVVKQL